MRKNLVKFKNDICLSQYLSFLSVIFGIKGVKLSKKGTIGEKWPALKGLICHHLHCPWKSYNVLRTGYSFINIGNDESVLCGGRMSYAGLPEIQRCERQHKFTVFVGSVTEWSLVVPAQHIAHIASSSSGCHISKLMHSLMENDKGHTRLCRDWMT
jgi:hypothetical protein